MKPPETYRTAAAALTTERKAAAAKLAKLAEAQINSLAMKVRFEIAVRIRARLQSCRKHARYRRAFSP